MKPVKLLAISCSPRRGNSDYLLDEALKVVDTLSVPVTTTRYCFAGKKIGGCLGCLKCYDNGGQCIIKDDYEQLRQLWINADAVVYSAPVYVVGIPGQLKCFYDRLHNAFYGYYGGVTSTRHMKAIGAIIQGFDLSGGQELGMQAVMQHASLINCMYTAPDGSFVGSGGWAEDMGRDAFKSKAEKNTNDYAITLRTARSVIQRIVELAAIVKAGMSELQGVLGEDPRYRPFLDRMEQQEDTSV